MILQTLNDLRIKAKLSSHLNDHGHPAIVTGAQIVMPWGFEIVEITYDEYADLPHWWLRNVAHNAVIVGDDRQPDLFKP